MRRTRDILRQHFEQGRSQRVIAASLGISKSVVGNVVRAARRLGLDAAAIVEMTDSELEERFYPPAPATRGLRPLPNWSRVHVEMLRHGVTLEVLHLEYQEQHPDGYRYSKFCGAYREWLRRQKPTMRQEHKAGDKMFVDYSGKKPHIVDSTTGVCTDVELFVAVLGASNYTYAEATLTQRSHDFIESHLRAFRFFGGAPVAVVPDQLKSGVTQACFYEPSIQRTYEEMAIHHATTVFPARPKHPRDKAKVEVGVQVVQRWVLARMRNQTFFSLTDLNERIAELIAELNDRVMRAYGKSRRQLFLELEQPALKPLPPTPFVYGEWSVARVNIDYHVQVEHHFYSTPFSIVHEQVDVRLTARTVELFHAGSRIASHARSRKRGGYTTLLEHMPRGHRAQAEWTPERITHWAATIGPNARGMVDAILKSRVHHEQGYRSCLGILRLAREYGPARLDAACARALRVGATSYKHVANTLKNGLDRVPLPADDSTSERTAVPHEHVRGRGYYH